MDFKSIAATYYAIGAMILNVLCRLVENKQTAFLFEIWNKKYTEQATGFEPATNSLEG